MAKKYVLLYGKKSVYERLQINPSSILQLLIKENASLPHHIEQIIQANNIPLERVPSHKFENLKKAKNVQGVIARVELFRYTPFEKLLSFSDNEKLSLVFLDRINDPQNLGLIIRSLACFGKFAIVLPDGGACQVTEAVLHVACGGENYVPVVKVPDLADAITAAKKREYWIMGALVNDGESINSAAMPFPVGLVLGAEIEGISPSLEQYLDAKIYIPMPGVGLSLNVGMACTVFAYEINKQKVV